MRTRPTIRARVLKTVLTVAIPGVGAYLLTGHTWTRLAVFGVLLLGAYLLTGGWKQAPIGASDPTEGSRRR